MGSFADQQGEWDEPIVVTVNDVAYPTQSYSGVQRFIPDPAVEEMVSTSLEHFRGPASGMASQNFYHLIPEGLKALTHPNPVVNFMVKANEHGFCSLNEIAIGLHEGKFTLGDWIDFQTLHGYSVGGFCDAVESQVSNLGYGESYIDEADGEEYEDYSDSFTISNPLWEDS